MSIVSEDDWNPPMLRGSLNMAVDGVTCGYPASRHIQTTTGRAGMRKSSVPGIHLSCFTVVW